MLVPFLIMLREGLEAALIVGIVAGYLRRTNRSNWLPTVWLGVVLAGLLCLALGVALHAAGAEFPHRQQELFEAAVGVVAVGILTSMVFWMRQASRSIGARLRESVDAALRPDGNSAWPLIGMVFLAVGREGVESVFFLLATAQQSTGAAVPIGAGLGLACAVLIGLAIYGGGVRLPLRHFFAGTGILIILVAAGLLAATVRALHNAGLWDGLQQTVFNLRGVLPAHGVVGTVLAGMFGYNDAPSLGELSAYLLYLVPVLAWFVLGRRRDRAPAASPA